MSVHTSFVLTVSDMNTAERITNDIMDHLTTNGTRGILDGIKYKKKRAEVEKAKPIEEKQVTPAKPAPNWFEMKDIRNAQRRKEKSQRAADERVAKRNTENGILKTETSSVFGRFYADCSAVSERWAMFEDASA